MKALFKKKNKSDAKLVFFWFFRQVLFFLSQLSKKPQKRPV